MATVLRIDNFHSSIIQERSYLSADVSSGATSVDIKSDQNFEIDNYVLIGEMTTERTELRLVTGVNDNTLTLNSGLDFEHKQYTTVTLLTANQLKIYRADDTDGTAPADGDFSLIDTVDIDFDQLTTRYTDSSGGSDHWYKYTYLNAQTSSETDLAQAEASRGGGIGTYTSLQKIREEAGIVNNQYLSDRYVAGKRTSAQGIIDTQLQGTYDVPFSDGAPEPIPRITELFAAGYILKREFGGGAAGTNADGQAKIDEAQAMLDKIVGGESRLVDSTGDELASRDTVSGWPDESTKTASAKSGGAERRFRMSDKY